VSGELEPRWLVGVAVLLLTPLVIIARAGDARGASFVAAVATLLVGLLWLSFITLVDRMRCGDGCNTFEDGWRYDLNAWQWLLVYWAGVAAVGLLAITVRFAIVRRYVLALASGALVAFCVAVALQR
jgi:hypothetical protein